MKTLLLVATVFFAFCSFGQTNGPAVEPSAEAKAIRQIARLYHVAYSNSIVIVKNDRRLSYKKLVVNVQKIDARGCPEDFRMAWSDFVEAIQERLKLHGELGELLELFLNPAAGVKDVNSKASKRTDAEIKIMQAKHELEKLGIKYGAF
jgi:hypothetical protein